MTRAVVRPRAGRTRLARLAIAATAAFGGLPPATGAAATPPAVFTAAATEIGPASATLTGQVNPRGLPTTYHFDYGPTAAYGASTPPADAEARGGGRHVAAAITGLTPGTGYHFRLVAQSSAGVTRGADRVFRTHPGAEFVSLTPVRNPVTLGASVFFTGQLTSTTRAERAVQLRQDPFPFSTATFVTVGSRVLTGPQGTFSIGVPSLSVTTRFEVVIPGRPDIHSVPVTVGVLTSVGTRVTRTVVPRRGRVRFSGTVRPAEGNRAVAIQRRRRGVWVTVAGMRTRVTPSGSTVYGRTIRVSRAGLYRVFVGAGSGATLPNAGREIRMQIRG